MVPKKAVAWTVANYVDQTWEDTPVKVTVRGFLDWKKEGAPRPTI